jgi:phospholipase C
LRNRTVILAIVVASFVVAGAAMLNPSAPSVPVLRSFADLPWGTTPHLPVTPIQHVVVIYQENHSFDDVLGGLCVKQHVACDGTTTGVLDDGTRIPLSAEPDIVPQVGHASGVQTEAINNGAMNGFNNLPNCGPPSFVCYTQYAQNEIPNLWKLASSYVISDRTFSENPVPSWGGHMVLIAGQLDGFRGNNPTQEQNVPPNPGWGCDSGTNEQWSDPTRPFSGYILVPACVPRPDGYGPYRSSPVKPIPTILDRLSSAGLSWKLYTDVKKQNSGYIWSVCPTFAECLYDPNNQNRPDPNWVPRSSFTSDASAGALPAYSVILPNYQLSQHNQVSMLQGDNYIQSLVGAVMNGPPAQWKSTVIFITYDDCGCFYDHVPPPPGSGLGVRVPMVIISPQAKASFVDHTQASFNSMLAFVEKNWGLEPLTANDANTYDYCHSFVFTMTGCSGPALAAAYRGSGPDPRAGPLRVDLHPSRVPAASIRWLATHAPDPNDPT